MSERRQAFRRDPIEIELEAEGRLISVGPVPWEQRNDLGNEIVKQHTEELNDSVKSFVTTIDDIEVPQLEARLANKLKDPFVVLKLGLEDSEFNKVVEKKIYPNQLTALLLAILEVNELEHLRVLVDPNAPTPGGLGGLISTILPNEDDVTPKTESGQNSLSGASTETPSEDSPTVKSETSSNSSNENEQTVNTGT